jgi:hypothetical protein
MTIFYCLRFETLPPSTGWRSYTPRHWIPFSSPPTTRTATVGEITGTQPRHGPLRKRLFYYCMFYRCRGNNPSTELFPSNDCCTVACLPSWYLTMGLHVSVLNAADGYVKRGKDEGGNGHGLWLDLNFTFIS